MFAMQSRTEGPAMRFVPQRTLCSFRVILKLNAARTTRHRNLRDPASALPSAAGIASGGSSPAVTQEAVAP